MGVAFYVVAILMLLAVFAREKNDNNKPQGV
jgi:hypothetical protein